MLIIKFTLYFKFLEYFIMSLLFTNLSIVSYFWNTSADAWPTIFGLKRGGGSPSAATLLPNNVAKTEPPLRGPAPRQHTRQPRPRTRVLLLEVYPTDIPATPSARGPSPCSL